MIIITIICVIVGILLTTTIHYKLLTDNQPGYPFGKSLVRFLWLDILIGFDIGFFLFFGGLIVILFFSKEQSNLTQ